MFWVKVIDNMKEIFRNFAQYFLEPLLQFLSDKIAGNDLNYFVSDVVRKKIVLLLLTGILHIILIF